MVLKEGIYHLGTSDLVAWWPFLLLAVLFYGLLPRVLLLAAGMVMQSKTIAGIRFTHSSCDRLIRRMTTPVMESGGNTPHQGVIKRRYPDSYPADNRDMELFGDDAEAIVLVPEDIADQCKNEDIDQALQTSLNIKLKQTMQVLFDSEEDRGVFEAVGRALSENAAVHVVVLQEAWQPPIEETLSYFQTMRSLIPKETHIHILLTGRMQNGNYFSPVDPLEETVWRQAFQALGDPHTEVRSIRMVS
jgi:hypothetical protein